MSLRNNTFVNSLSNNISNIKNSVKMPSMKMPSVKMPSVKMPSVKMPSVKMPSMKVQNVSIDKSASKLGYIYNSIIGNIGIIFLFMVIILSLLFFVRMFNIDFSKKEDGYHDSKSFFLKRNLKEGHKNGVPKHTGNVNQYCWGTCGKYIINDDGAEVCAKGGCCDEVEAKMTKNDEWVWDWKTNANWQKKHQDYYCHCWLAHPRREGKCCRSYVSGVTVTPNDIFADCSPENAGKSYDSSDDDSDDDGSGSGCGKKCRQQKQDQCEMIEGKCYLDYENYGEECQPCLNEGDSCFADEQCKSGGCDDCLGWCKDKATCTKYEGVGFNQECKNDDQCGPEYVCRTRRKNYRKFDKNGEKREGGEEWGDNKKRCRCRTRGTTNDPETNKCTLCDTSDSINYEHWRDSEGNVKENSRCDSKGGGQDETYLSHKRQGINEGSKLNTKGKGVIKTTGDPKLYVADKKYAFKGGEGEGWELIKTGGESKSNFNENTPSRTGIDTRGFGVVPTALSARERTKIDAKMWTGTAQPNYKNLNTGDLDTDSWPKPKQEEEEEKEGFQGYTLDDCYDETKINDEDFNKCTEWWDTAYSCKDYGPEFCQQKTALGEVKCLEYPCCLWEFNTPNKPPVFKDDDMRIMGADITFTEKNRNAFEAEESSKKIFTKFSSEFGSGRCVKGTPFSGPYDRYEKMKEIENYNKNKKKERRQTLLELNVDAKKVMEKKIDDAISKAEEDAKDSKNKNDIIKKVREDTKKEVEEEDEREGGDDRRWIQNKGPFTRAEMNEEDIFKKFNKGEKDELWANGLPSQKSKRVKQIFSPNSHQDYYYYTEFKNRRDGGAGKTGYYRNFDGMSKEIGEAYEFNKKKDENIPGRCLGDGCANIVHQGHNKKFSGNLEENDKFWPEREYDDE